MAQLSPGSLNHFGGEPQSTPEGFLFVLEQPSVPIAAKRATAKTAELIACTLVAGLFVKLGEGVVRALYDCRAHLLVELPHLVDGVLEGVHVKDHEGVEGA